MHAISVALSIIPFPFVVREMFRRGGGWEEAFAGGSLGRNAVCTSVGIILCIPGGCKFQA